MSWPLLLMSGILGSTIIGSYIVVFGNVGNAFPVPHNTGGYLESAYWHGVPRDTTTAILVFQIFAGLGFLAWLFWLVNAPSIDGPLQQAWVKSSLVGTFLIASIAWPYAAHAHIASPTMLRTLVVSSCLWVAAVAVLLMVAVTFEARAPAVPTVGILLLGNVVVLADGVGWTAIVLRKALYE